MMRGRDGRSVMDKVRDLLPFGTGERERPRDGYRPCAWRAEPTLSVRRFPAWFSSNTRERQCRVRMAASTFPTRRDVASCKLGFAAPAADSEA